MELFTFKQFDELYTKALHTRSGSASLQLTEHIGIFIEGSSQEIFVEVNEIYNGEWIPFDNSSDYTDFDPMDNGIDFDWVYRDICASIKVLMEDLSLDIRAHKLVEYIAFARDEYSGMLTRKINDRVGMIIETYEDCKDVLISIEEIVDGEWEHIDGVVEEVSSKRMPYGLCIRLQQIIDSIKR